MDHSTILRVRIARHSDQEQLLSTWTYKHQDVFCDQCKKLLGCGFHAVDTTYDLCIECHMVYFLASQTVSVRQWVEFQENIPTKKKVAKIIDQEILLNGWIGSNSNVECDSCKKNPLVHGFHGVGTNNDLCVVCHTGYVANGFLANNPSVALMTQNTWVEFVESPSVHAQRVAIDAAEKARIIAETSRTNESSGRGGMNTANGVIVRKLPNGEYAGESNRNNHMHGYGVLMFFNRDSYYGMFKDDKRSGHGVYKYANGDEYLGEWQNSDQHGRGVFHGHGVYRWVNGDMYMGAYKDDMRNGHGVKRLANGIIFHDGEWKDDEPLLATNISVPPVPPIAPLQPLIMKAAAPRVTLMNPTGKHIMISYCWAQKDLVRALATFLRDNKGYDVWTDELGSQVCSQMADDIDAKMAEAVEKSHTVLVFVSREYNASVNCQKEASYAHQRKDNGKVNIVYVMMQSDYTTVGGCIEGRLGLWIGQKLWYPLFDANQIASTGIALAELIGEQGKLVVTPGVSAGVPNNNAAEAKLTFEQEQRLCVVCMVNPKSVKLAPCRHMCICPTCSDIAALRNCPVCRAVIINREKLFI